MPPLGTKTTQPSPSARSKTMTDEQLAAMHRLLAEYHRNLAKEVALDIVQQYHADLAQRLADEAAQIPRRTAILERLHEREQQKTEDGDVDKCPLAEQLGIVGCGRHDEGSSVAAFQLSPCHRKHNLPDQLHVRPSSDRSGIALSNRGRRSHWHRPS